MCVCVCVRVCLSVRVQTDHTKTVVAVSTQRAVCIEWSAGSNGSLFGRFTGIRRSCLRRKTENRSRVSRGPERHGVGEHCTACALRCLREREREGERERERERERVRVRERE